MGLVTLTLDQWANVPGDSISPKFNENDIIGVLGADQFNLNGIYAINKNGLELDTVTIKANINKEGR